MRKFYVTWRAQVPLISQKPSAKLALEQKSQKPSGKLPTTKIGQPASDQLPTGIAQKSSAQLPPTPPVPFTLSWSHYVLLLTIKDVQERSFYEIEATQSVSAGQEGGSGLPFCYFEPDLKGSGLFSRNPRHDLGPLCTSLRP